MELRITYNDKDETHTKMFELVNFKKDSSEIGKWIKGVYYTTKKEMGDIKLILKVGELTVSRAFEFKTLGEANRYVRRFIDGAFKVFRG